VTLIGSATRVHVERAPVVQSGKNEHGPITHLAHRGCHRHGLVRESRGRSGHGGEPGSRALRDSPPGAANREAARAPRARDVSSIADLSKTADPAGRRAGPRGHRCGQAPPNFERRGGDNAIRTGAWPPDPSEREIGRADLSSLVELIAHELEHVLEPLDDVNLTQMAESPGVRALGSVSAAEVRLDSHRDDRSGVDNPHFVVHRANGNGRLRDPIHLRGRRRHAPV
jgi:hypothetical protein